MKYLFLFFSLLFLGSSIQAQQKIKCNLILVKKDKSHITKATFYNQAGLVLEKELADKPDIVEILTQENKDSIFLNFSFFVRTKDKLVPDTMRSNFKDTPELNQFLHEVMESNFEFNVVLNECNEPIPQPSTRIKLIFFRKDQNQVNTALVYGGIDKNYGKRREATKPDFKNTPIHPRCKNISNVKANKKCMSKELNSYISKNFDKVISKQLKKKGCRQKCYAQFLIDEKGRIKNIETISSNTVLSTEVKRLLKRIQGIKPAMDIDGNAIGVLYSLPVIYRYGKN